MANYLVTNEDRQIKLRLVDISLLDFWAVKSSNGVYTVLKNRYTSETTLSIEDFKDFANLFLIE